MAKYLNKTNLTIRDINTKYILAKIQNRINENAPMHYVILHKGYGDIYLSGTSVWANVFKILDYREIPEQEYNKVKALELSNDAIAKKMAKVLIKQYFK